MLLEVGEFCDRTAGDVDTLIRQLQESTGRYGEAERNAWASSLLRVGDLLGKPQLSAFRGYHLHVGQRGNISVEYRLPASSSWCDVVLLGRGVERPAAVILELKDWVTAGDRPGPSAGLIEHQGSNELHPAEQVRGYAEYCRRFHSAIHEGGDVSGAVYFTRAVPIAAYLSPPHKALTDAYPVFSDTTRDLDSRLPRFLSERLLSPDVDFACRFEGGTYRQDRSFCKQVAQRIMDADEGPFVLLDAQRKGFELCRLKLKEALASEHSKLVLIVEGPPGSGKSALAAHLWAGLVHDTSLPEGNVVLTTTSSSQRSNWEKLFAEASVDGSGRGIVKPANQYAPETTAWIGNFKLRHGPEAIRAEKWIETLRACRREVKPLRCPDDTYLVSIVDEAHALLNSERKKAQVGVTGWPAAFGPQAYHIIRASKVSIFLLDSEQSFRDRETTTATDIETWARLLNAEVPPRVSLAGVQFRAGGSTEYLNWVEALLGWQTHSGVVATWRRSATNPGGKFGFEIVPDPLALEDALRERIVEGASARLLAAYGRPWKTKGVRAPHGLPGPEKDFHIAYKRDGKALHWSKVWNVAPGNPPDYSLFVQAPQGSKMHADPLCEVGCPYVVRGFDYDNVGILWLKDLVWRCGQWKVDIKHIYESGIRLTLAEAKREKHLGGPATTELVRRVQQAYRILLSRALKGAYVWFEDAETREHVEQELV